MANTRKENPSENPTTAARSLAIAEAGIHTGEDFANMMSALMSDVIEGRVTPPVANATCNAGGKLLKVIEMEYKYGSVASPNAPKKPRLQLAR